MLFPQGFFSGGFFSPGLFDAASTATVPTTPSVPGYWLTEEQVAQLLEDVAYIRGRLIESVSEGLVDFAVAQPRTPGMAALNLYVRNFSQTVKDATFTITMEQKAPVVLTGGYEQNRVLAVTTVNGSGMGEVYPSQVLADAGYSPYYRVQCARLGLDKRVLIPAGASSVADLADVPHA